MANCAELFRSFGDLRNRSNIVPLNALGFVDEEHGDIRSPNHVFNRVLALVHVSCALESMGFVDDQYFVTICDVIVSIVEGPRGPEQGLSIFSVSLVAFDQVFY